MELTFRWGRCTIKTLSNEQAKCQANTCFGAFKGSNIKKKKLNLKGQGFSVCNFGIFPYFAVESFY